MSAKGPLLADDQSQKQERGQSLADNRSRSTRIGTLSLWHHCNLANDA